MLGKGVSFKLASRSFATLLQSRDVLAQDNCGAAAVIYAEQHSALRPAVCGSIYGKNNSDDFNSCSSNLLVVSYRENA